LEYIQKKHRNKRKEINYYALVDLEKAFDRVYREVLNKKWLVNAVTVMDEGAVCTDTGRRKCGF